MLRPTQGHSRLFAATVTVIVAALGLGPLEELTAGAERVVVDAGGTPSSYVPTTSARLADTRLGSCGCQPIDTRTVRVVVAGRAGVPAGATAAHVTITVTDISSPLHVTAWPAGRARPTASILNAAPSDIAAATSIPIALGTGGAIDVAVSRNASVVVDVAGAWVASGPARRGGRYRPMSSNLVTVGLSGGAPTEVPTQAVPGALALVVSIDVEPRGPAGFVAAWPSGVRWPGTSLLNHRSVRRRTTAIVPTGAAGTIQLLSSTDAVATVGVIGALVEATGPDGLFVPSPPVRVVDTRVDLGLPWAAAGQMPASGSVIRHRVDASGGVAVLAVTTVGGSPGVVAANPGGIIHYRAGPDARADTAYTSISGSRTIDYTLEGPTHLIADVMGYFTGPTVQSSNIADLTVLPDQPWTPARRWGTACETRLLAHLDRHMPTHLRWALPFIEIRVSTSLPISDANAAFANYRYLEPRGYRVPSVGTVSGPMTVLVRSAACTGSDREAYLVTHEAVGHLIDSLFDDIDGCRRVGGRRTGLSFNGVSPMMPSFASTPARQAIELFADCVTVVLGTAISPGYTTCADVRWRAETAAILAHNPLHLRALPLRCAVHQVIATDMSFESTALGGRIARGEAPALVSKGSTISTCTVAHLTPFGSLWATTDNVVVLATPDGSLYRPVMTGVMARYG